MKSLSVVRSSLYSGFAGAGFGLVADLCMTTYGCNPAAVFKLDLALMFIIQFVGGYGLIGFAIGLVGWGIVAKRERLTGAAINRGAVTAWMMVLTLIVALMLGALAVAHPRNCYP